MRAIVVYLIGLYQRYLSPRNGFRCAHAAYHRGASCSAAVKDIVAVHGLLHGFPLIRRRFQECRLAAYAMSDESEQQKRKRRGRSCDVDNIDCCPDSLPHDCHGGGCPRGGCSDADACQAEPHCSRLWVRRALE